MEGKGKPHRHHCSRAGRTLTSRWKGSRAELPPSSWPDARARANAPTRSCLTAAHSSFRERACRREGPWRRRSPPPMPLGRHHKVLCGARERSEGGKEGTGGALLSHCRCRFSIFGVVQRWTMWRRGGNEWPRYWGKGLASRVLFGRSMRSSVGWPSTTAIARATFGPGEQENSRPKPRLWPRRGERRSELRVAGHRGRARPIGGWATRGGSGPRAAASAGPSGAAVRWAAPCSSVDPLGPGRGWAVGLLLLAHDTQ
jgi:hypothetical protein